MNKIKRLLTLMFLLTVVTGAYATDHIHGYSVEGTLLTFKSTEDLVTVVKEGDTPVGWKVTKEDFTITALKGTAEQAPVQDETTKDYHLYPGNVLTIEATSSWMIKFFLTLSSGNFMQYMYKITEPHAGGQNGANHFMRRYFNLSDKTSTSTVTLKSDCPEMLLRQIDIDKQAIPEVHTHTPGAAIEENVEPSTCEGYGSYDLVVYCSECGEELSRTAFQIEPLGHDYGDWTETKSPTCTKDGERTRTCHRDPSHVDIEYIPALGHDYASVVTPPTCEEAGFSTYTCTRCGDTYVGDEMPALGHDYGDPVYVWADDYSQVTATCTCHRDATHEQSETVQTTQEETKVQTDTESGEVVYTATFSKPGFTTQTKVVTIPSWNELWDEYYYVGTIGNIYSPEQTVFNIWNPLARKVSLKRYATGTDAEANAEVLGIIEMEQLMDGDSWTGVWTVSVGGDINGSYYTYVVDGEEMPDPWTFAESSDGKRSMVCDISRKEPDGWEDDVHVFNEQGNTVKNIDATTTADILNGMAALKESDINTVAMTVTYPQLVPDQKSSDPNDGAKVISEVKQAIQTIHKEYGMSVFINLDFSTVPVNPVMRHDYILNTCVFWAWQYHADGIVLATDIDAQVKSVIRASLDEIDPRVVFGTEEEIMSNEPDAIEGIATDTSDGTWYTLSGVKLDGEPTTPGVYVKDGKKVYVK